MRDYLILTAIILSIATVINLSVCVYFYRKHMEHWCEMQERAKAMGQFWDQLRRIEQEKERR